MIDIEKIKDAKKKKDGWWASLFSGPAANLLLPYVAEVDWITPNCVTSSSLFICFIASAFIATGISSFLIIGAILVQLVFILDCLDGQLARYRKAGTNFGAWYDRVTDRVKDFCIYFSIALGHYKIYEDWLIWPLAMGALFFVYLFDYYVNQDVKLLPKEQNVAEDGGESSQTTSKKALLNKMFSLGSAVYKSCPLLQFHIGEQYFLISFFLFFNQTRLFLYMVIMLGFFYAFYWPLAQYYGKKPST